MNICVYGASSNDIDKSFIEAGEELGKAIASHSHTLVFGGGASGMMGAAARGAEAGKGKILGISPSFFNVDGVLFDRCTDFIYTETMRERKQLLEEKSDGFIVTPGGIGTFDEFFEILALRQLDKHRKPILLYNVNGYFNPLIKMLESCAEQKFMFEDNLNLFAATDNAEDAVKYLENYTVSENSAETYR